MVSLIHIDMASLTHIDIADVRYGSFKMDMSLNKLQEMMKDSEAWRVAVRGITNSQPQLSD